MEYPGTWREIWEQKGEMEGAETDIRIYDGWEKSEISINSVAKRIIDILNIKPDDRVLEIGCGAGALSKYIPCDYVGVDYSRSLVKKNIEFYRNSCIWGEAADLPFKDGIFDKVFSWGVFLYFENKDYAARAINEMKRVTKNGGGIFIGELPKRSHSTRHCLYSESDFFNWDGWEIINGLTPPYENDRFNVLMIKKGEWI